MRKTREKIDNFLVVLDNFIDKHVNYLSSEQILTLVLPFKHSIPVTRPPENKMEFKILVELINKSQQNKYVKGPKIRRGSSYLRRAAYSIEYQEVVASSYEEILCKITGVQSSDLVLKDFYKKNPGNYFMIPEDYGEIDSDLHYNGDYEIFK